MRGECLEVSVFLIGLVLGRYLILHLKYPVFQFWYLLLFSVSPLLKLLMHSLFLSYAYAELVNGARVPDSKC